MMSIVLKTTFPVPDLFSHGLRIKTQNFNMGYKQRREKTEKRHRDIYKAQGHYINKAIPTCQVIYL